MKTGFRFLPFVLALPLALTAQQPPAGGDMERLARLFERMDANGDGKLVREELPERLRPNFERVDADGDGFITPDEHRAVARRPAPEGAASSRNSQRPVPAGMDVQRDLPYAGTENPRQTLDLYLSKDQDRSKPLPVIVFIHGGGWRNGDKSSGQGHLSRFVASGKYAGVSVGYRLTGEAQWPAQIHDCKAAIRWIKGNASKYGLNPEMIGVWGTSAGGHLVSLLGTSGDVKELEGTLGGHMDQSSKVTCVMNYYGPENFLTMIRQPSTIDRTKGGDYPEALLLGGPVTEREAEARAASPVTHVSAGDAAFFTAHGTKDPLVPFAQGEEIHAALTKAGVPSILQEMTDGGHGFRSEVLDVRVQQFFDLHLRGQKTDIESAPIKVEMRK